MVGAEGQALIRAAGAAANALLRMHLTYFLAEVLRNPNDPRFAEKAIPVRNLAIVGALSLLFPALHLGRRRWRRYPFWTDDLWLSVFWLDMAGNSFDLYDRFAHFDLLPHFHGTGAAALALRRAFRLSPRGAFGIANAVHALLEAQELATDVLFGTRNVRGWWDTAGDLAAGLAGSALYVTLSGRLESPSFVLFHRIADPASAAVRREIVARGLKPRIDFQNVDESAGRRLFARHRGKVVPSLWDGTRLHEGSAVRARLARLGT